VRLLWRAHADAKHVRLLGPLDEIGVTMQSSRELLEFLQSAKVVTKAPKRSPGSCATPFLPNKSRGVRRVNDRRVLNGIFWVLRSGAPWRDLPVCYGPRTTCYNRFVRWRKAGVWCRIMDSLAAAHDAAVQMVDTSIVRVHQPRCLRRQKQKPVDGSFTRRIDQQNSCGGGHERAACPSGTYSGRSS
jgi:transposase